VRGYCDAHMIRGPFLDYKSENCIIQDVPGGRTSIEVSSE
jgi:hypothetical protein